MFHIEEYAAVGPSEHPEGEWTEVGTARTKVGAITKAQLEQRCGEFGENAVRVVTLDNDGIVNEVWNSSDPHAQ